MKHHLPTCRSRRASSGTQPILQLREKQRKSNEVAHPPALASLDGGPHRGRIVHMLTAVRAQQEIDEYRHRADALYDDVREWIATRLPGAGFHQSPVQLNERSTG